jgi:hypothetical protein
MRERFPLQAECDLTKPEEHFLWALCQIPFGPKLTQPIMLKVAKVISKHLYECGFRFHPKLQTKKLILPHRGQRHHLNGSAIWAPMDTDEPAPVKIPDVRKMTQEEQDILKQEMIDYGIISEDVERDLGKTAEVVTATEKRSAKVHTAKAKRVGAVHSGRAREDRRL